MERPEERIALIELFERDGHVGRTVDVTAWPLTLGRALNNHIVIDDPHLAPQHAQLAVQEDGRLLLQALPSRNGVRMDGRPVQGSAVVPAGGCALQLGATRLRLRLGDETLAPELPLAHGVGSGRRAPLLAGLAVAAILLASHWLTLDPGADFSTWLPMVVGMPLVLAGWCGVWALTSKLFQHRFDFGGHLRIVLPWLLAMLVADLVWPQLTAALAAPRLWMLGATIEGLLLALMVRAHLGHVLPLHQRAVTLSVATLALASATISAALTYRSTDSLVAAPYMSTLPMPALRLAGTVPSAVLVQDMAPLADKLAARVQKAKADDADGESDGTD